MAEHAYGPVELKLAGETLALRLTMRSVREVKQRTGVDLLGGKAAAEGINQSGMSMGEVLPVLCWAMLPRDSLTLEQVEDAIDLSNVEYVTRQVFQACGADLGDGEEGEAKEGEGDGRPLDGPQPIALRS